MSNSTTKTNQKQSNTSIQADLNKLKLILAESGDVIARLESNLELSKSSNSKMHKFHGKSTKARPTAIMTIDGEVLAEYESMSAAAEAIGKSLTSVWRGCKNPGMVVVGHKFKYLYDEKGESV